MARYREWSRRVWDLVTMHSECVEQIGIEEGYLVLDASGEAHAHRIRQAIRDQVRLSASLGVATCKVVAKIASDRDKPGGITGVAPGDEATFLAPLPLRALPGIGPRTGERLGVAGVTTVGDLAALSDAVLATLMPGQVGAELRDRASGIDPRPVAAEPAERVSISMEMIQRRYSDFQAITRANTCRPRPPMRMRSRQPDKTCWTAHCGIVSPGPPDRPRDQWPSSHPQLSLFPRLPGRALYERHEEVYTPPIR